MNSKKILAIVLLFFATAASCSNEPRISQINSPQQIETQTYRSTGVIKRVDKEMALITIDHEEIPGYMSPMEMTEPVAQPALLDAVKAGDKVDFEILRTGANIKFTAFTKTGEVAFVEGEDIYIASCAECHGVKGEGADRGIPLTSGHALDHTEADFIKTVTNGKTKRKDKEMPAYRDKLTVEQIAAVVRFIREDLQKGIPNGKRHDH